MLTLEEQQVEYRQEEEQRGTKRRISLSKCAVCAADESKYKCPACLINTCCFQCVKKHKDVSGCSGVRNKTAFVTMSHFNEMALLSDYRFLEDTGRFVNSATRDCLLRSPLITITAKKMINMARRMKITLKLLPVTFTKSRENSTVFNAREKKFLWHLKLMFPQNDSEFTQRRVPDTLTLEQILTPYVHPTESDHVKRQRLKMYVLTPFNHIKVFMKAEGRKANSVRYHEMDIQRSLRDNLSFKTLVEYPVLYVVLRDGWKDYPLKGAADPASNADHKEKPTATSQDQRNPSPAEMKPGFTPNIAPPMQKKTKREKAEHEREEGEISESSDNEEGEEEGCGRAVENQTCGQNNEDADHMKVIKKEVPVCVDLAGDNDGQNGSENML